jgi:hypothetical protein
MMALSDSSLAEALQRERLENAQAILEKSEAIGQRYL